MGHHSPSAPPDGSIEAGPRGRFGEAHGRRAHRRLRPTAPLKQLKLSHKAPLTVLLTVGSVEASRSCTVQDPALLASPSAPADGSVEA